MVATCKDCLHFDVCKYKDEKVSIGTKVEELVSDDFICFKNKADFDKTIDDLITEIHCLEAKCRKFEAENEDLKISIEVRDDFINKQNEEIKRLEKQVQQIHF